MIVVAVWSNTSSDSSNSTKSNSSNSSDSCSGGNSTRRKGESVKKVGPNQYHVCGTHSLNPIFCDAVRQEWCVECDPVNFGGALRYKKKRKWRQW